MADNNNLFGMEEKRLVQAKGVVPDVYNIGIQSMQENIQKGGKKVAQFNPAVVLHYDDHNDPDLDDIIEN